MSTHFRRLKGDYSKGVFCGIRLFTNGKASHRIVGFQPTMFDSLSTQPVELGYRIFPLQGIEPMSLLKWLRLVLGEQSNKKPPRTENREHS